MQAITLTAEDFSPISSISVIVESYTTALEERSQCILNTQKDADAAERHRQRSISHLTRSCHFLRALLVAKELVKEDTFTGRLSWIQDKKKYTKYKVSADSGEEIIAAEFKKNSQNPSEIFRQPLIDAIAEDSTPTQKTFRYGNTLLNMITTLTEASKSRSERSLPANFLEWLNIRTELHKERYWDGWSHHLSNAKGESTTLVTGDVVNKDHAAGPSGVEDSKE